MKLINSFLKKSIQLWVEDEKLKASFPKEISNLEKYREVIKANRQNIFNILLNNKIFFKDDFNLKNIFRFNMDSYPLSFAQERLWFIEQYEQGTNAYHIPLLLSLNKSTEVE
ncbi:hypothetical protein, partial [Francisella philomiragia]|uniref:hypothetical protein n=1 Tax=Francisella philomiragia TaxID=28110 RepID=UPI001C9DA3D2